MKRKDKLINEIKEISNILSSNRNASNDDANEAIKVYFQKNLTSEMMHSSSAGIINKIELCLISAANKSSTPYLPVVIEEHLTMLKEVAEEKRSLDNQNLLLLYLKQAMIILNKRTQSGSDFLFPCSVLQAIKDRV